MPFVEKEPNVALSLLGGTHRLFDEDKAVIRKEEWLDVGGLAQKRQIKDSDKAREICTSVVVDKSTHLQGSMNKQLAEFEHSFKKLIIKDAERLSLNASQIVFQAKELVKVVGLGNLKHKKA